MVKVITKPMRVNPESEEILRKIAAQRYSDNLDKVQLKPYRLLEATLRIPNVKEILRRSKIKNDL